MQKLSRDLKTKQQQLHQNLVSADSCHKELQKRIQDADAMSNSITQKILALVTDDAIERVSSYQQLQGAQKTTAMQMHRNAERSWLLESTKEFIALLGSLQTTLDEPVVAQKSTEQAINKHFDQAIEELESMKRETLRAKERVLSVLPRGEAAKRELDSSVKERFQTMLPAAQAAVEQAQNEAETLRKQILEKDLQTAKEGEARYAEANCDPEYDKYKAVRSEIAMIQQRLVETQSQEEQLTTLAEALANMQQRFKRDEEPLSVPSKKRKWFSWATFGS
eukprot:TRINITY_DN33336_c0_g1_i1.p1 TRINITY_DN33336_c0_g1~~TRINITY_DN33336_c0_g1_i1.p1  ORF type:complete len:279 (+),score=71.35 TRINITY_DN33336_c0_g1_i1:68-904(+)